MRRVRGSLGRRGLGFVFVSGLMGIDLDNVLDDNGEVVSTWAARVLARLCPTYVERSPRGHGLHLYGTCAYPCTGGINRKIVCDDGRVIGAEMYGEGRYFTVTGDTDTPAPLGVWAPELIVTLREEIEHLSHTHERARARAGDNGRAGEEIRARAHEHEGLDFDFDYDATTVDTVKMLEIGKRKKFRDHWARVSEKGSDSERGAGIARLCQQAGWTPEEVCAVLNKWCDDTGQERYHATKMRNTLAFVFAPEEKKQATKAPMARDTTQLQAFIEEKLGLHIDKIVQKGHDTPSYVAHVTGMDDPYIIASYAQFEKRQTWQQLAYSTAVMHRYTALPPITSRQWPEILTCLVNLCVFEPLEESDTAVETAEWLTQVFDGTTQQFESLATMSLHELGMGAFYTADGTAYLKLPELLRVCQLNGIKVSRSELISRLHNEGWQPPPKSGHSKREGTQVHTFRFWSKPL
jgi:hypothetical protein